MVMRLGSEFSVATAQLKDRLAVEPDRFLAELSRPTANGSRGVLDPQPPPGVVFPRSNTVAKMGGVIIINYNDKM
jgi:hypothetical protein